MALDPDLLDYGGSVTAQQRLRHRENIVICEIFWRDGDWPIYEEILMPLLVGIGR